MPFKICLTGCGALANSHHGPAFVKYAHDHPDTELTACCDLNPHKADDFSRSFGFQRSYTDPLLMLDTESPDAVCLVVPPAVTCALACQILEMRFPLLLEKPPGLTTAEIDRMITTAQSTGTPNQVAFNRRYTPLVTALKQRILELEPPGGLQHLQYDFYRVGRTDPDFSTTAIHGIDAARFLAGSPYSRIAFHYRQFPELGPTTANILLDCTFASSATAQISFLPVSGAVIERATLHFYDRIFFLHLPIWNAFDSPGSLVEVVQGQVISILSGPQVSGSTEDFILNGFYAEDAAFFDAIRSGCSPQGDLATCRQSVEIAHCLRDREPSYSLESA
jgi:myo-inositol 2-dehydrogenase / D-chiro-inositol 1-dehydrogenase